MLRSRLSSALEHEAPGVGHLGQGQADQRGQGDRRAPLREPSGFVQIGVKPVMSRTGEARRALSRCPRRPASRSLRLDIVDPDDLAPFARFSVHEAAQFVGR